MATCSSRVVVQAPCARLPARESISLRHRRFDPIHSYLPPEATPPAFLLCLRLVSLELMSEGLELAREYHRNLPAHVREYLQQARGISGELIELHRLRWNGSRITIPVLDRAAQFAFFKLAKGPNDQSDSSKMLASPGAHAELYDWQRVLSKPEQIIICEGEFDRLVLEIWGFVAVTSIGGARNFRLESAEALREI